VDELDSGAEPLARVRRAGGGCKRPADLDPSLAKISAGPVTWRVREEAFAVERAWQVAPGEERVVGTHTDSLPLPASAHGQVSVHAR
jgi:hypothetical protein